nr:MULTISPECIES: MBL fold metallo-hydrolase RNA specificity domain-containing protein [unclassified Lactonifactor]
MIVFSGYTGNNPSYLSYRIQNYKDHKTININKKPVPNRADCITMSTFSSHANNEDLVTYGSSLNTNKLILVHGAQDAKEILRKQLQDAISKNDRTYRVLSSSKDMVVHL